MSDEQATLDLPKVVIPLYRVNGDGTWSGLGTATVIAAMGDTATAITAKHVLEKVADAVQSRRPAYPRVVEVTALIGEEPDPMIAKSSLFSLPAYSDLAFAILSAPAGRRFEVAAAVDPSPVATGTAVRSMGYSELSMIHRMDAEGVGDIRFTNHMAVHDGVVTDRHPAGIRRINWPVVQAHTPIHSTMSGGPMFEVRNDSLVLRAVLCSDMSETVDTSRGDGCAAYASEVWPSLPARIFEGARFEAEAPEGDLHEVSLRNFLDLIRFGYVADAGDTLRNFATTAQGVSWAGVQIWEAPPVADDGGWLPGR